MHMDGAMFEEIFKPYVYTTKLEQGSIHCDH
jgi:hypothetical protein